MFSAIPKIADKNFVVAYLLPVLLFFSVILVYFHDSDFAQDIIEKFTGEEKELGKIAFLVIALWAASIALMVLNQMLFKVLEGYYVPGFLARWRKQRQRIIFDRIDGHMNRIKRIYEETPDAFTDQHEIEYDFLYCRKVKRFPARDRLLPTSFGNAIRAFEDYSRTVYGADALPLWVHLGTVIPKDYGANVEDARAQVSLYMNIVVLAIAFAGIGLTRFCLDLLWPDPEATHAALVGQGLARLGWVLASLGVASVAYHLSLERIHSWGSLVKAGFDCYLPELAQKLGYSLPATSADQKLFWEQVSRRAIFHKPLVAEAWPRAGSENACTPEENRDEDAKDEQEDENE